MPTPSMSDTADDVCTNAQEVMTLSLPIVANPECLARVRNALAGLSGDLLARELDGLGIVHFLRFAILDNNVGGCPRLIVTATFDGTLESFVHVMWQAVGKHLRAMLDCIEGAQEAVVDEDSLAAYVDQHDVKAGGGQTYRAYPGVNLRRVRDALSALELAEGRDGSQSDIQQSLLLVMPIKPCAVASLKESLPGLQYPPLSPIEALDRVGTVHSTRFVVFEGGGGADGQTPWAKLAVVATFDGDTDEYLKAFARELSLQFNLLFGFIVDAPPTPVEDRDKVEGFVSYVKAHTIDIEGPVYRAYPGWTALDIDSAVRLTRAKRSVRHQQSRGGEPALAPSKVVPFSRRATPLRVDDLDDIQGLILRGYRKDQARHIVLRIKEGRDEPFRRLLARMANERQAEVPFVTVAADWTNKPSRITESHHCVNIGFTYAGLKAMSVDEQSLLSFPDSFRSGAVERAAYVGDTDSSAPGTWRPSFAGDGPHVIVSVYADTRTDLDTVTRTLEDELGDSVSEPVHLEAQRLEGRDIEHFGYVDGLSQPTIDGAPTAGIPDPFPAVPAGEFVLGHPTQRGGPWEPMPTPDALSRNGSFAAFRVMDQDVKAFEEFLTRASAEKGIDREFLAAKLCGRWRRSGEPLVLRPVDAKGDGRVRRHGRNMFDYERTATFDNSDYEGLLCPRGAHIRRAFPRSQRVVDDATGLGRRLVRRAMPYGPKYDPYDPTDGDAEDRRGLIGMFICASLENQFEYVMRNWINGGLFAAGVAGASDPLAGTRGDGETPFAVPGTSGAKSVNVPRFVRTRGCAYLFLPSKTALRWLAEPPGEDGRRP